MKKPKYVMSHSELKTVREDAQMQRAMLKQMEQEGYGSGSRGSVLDKSAVEKQARHYEKLADSHTPEKLKSLDKDKLAKRASELEGKMREGMCSHDEMRNLKGNPGAPMKHLDWERRNGSNAYEYKQIMRRLEPNDPGASSIEKFRR